MPTITEMSASGPGLATVSLRPSHDGFDDLPNHFWSSQIAHAREAVRAGHTDSRHALARTLVAAYKHGLYSDYNVEALHLFRSLQTSLSEDIDLTISLTLEFGEALFDEYRRTGEIEPVEELLRSRTRTPSHEPLLRVSLLDCYFARGLLARGAFTGNQADILDAKTIIDSLACHIENTPHPNLLVALAEYHEVAWRTNNQYDLEQLHCLRCSLTEQLRRDGPTPNHPGILTSLFSVCTVLCLTSSYIDEYALRTARHALELQIKPLPDLFGTLSALASFYTTTARVSKETIYMGQARECIHRMFVSAQDNKMDRGEAHYALGQWLFIRRNRFHMGDTSLFSDASTQIHKALSLCPTHHIYRYRYMVGATVCLLRQFECTGSVSALDDGIKLCQRSWEMVSTRALLAVNASSLLNWRARAGRLRLESRQALLRRSIEVLETALDHTPDSSTYRAELLYAMSAAYAQHGELGLVVDRAEQICVARSAVSAHMDNPAQRSRALCRLAQVLATTAQEEQSTEALHESMSLIQDVTEESTDPIYRQCQEQASGLASLQAHCHLIRYKLQGDDADLATAQELFELSFRDLTGRVTDQLTNSISWADKARYIAQPKLEMRAYRKAISILPQLAYIGGDVRTRVEALQLVEGLASRAAVVALTMHDAPGAVELLEQTRGVVWSQSLQLQAPPEVVPLPHAQDFARIAEALRVESEGEPEERRQWAEQLEAVIARIRQVEGYEDFMLPQVYAKLKACASHGAVVLVVPSGQFTDVIIITDPESAPVHLRLSALKRSRLHELTARLKRTSDYARDSAHEEYRKIKMVGVGARSAGSKLEEEYIAVLSELWLRLVYPVIVSLGIKRSPKDAPTTRPRLWWCPAGPFAELPLHAAGVYKGPDQDCVSNYVVSSYTPTLTAVLLVSLPDVSGLPSLPNARIEADLVRMATSVASTTTLTDGDASVANVMGSLPSASVLHLACHGHQSQDDPLASGFSLHDGRLTLERLMQLHLPHAELAYLSACETASTDEYQPDEAINLAATMLFVGFKSIIATMWSMNDLDGPFVAQRVYKAIFREGKLDLSAVPYAVDGAVRELRESGVHPSRWATYVHIGA